MLRWFHIRIFWLLFIKHQSCWLSQFFLQFQCSIMTNEPPTQNNNSPNNNHEQPPVLRDSIRRRLRSIAEREASRLARPERPNARRILPHTSHSQRTSTPSGVIIQKKTKENNDDWCGPFSVARQVSIVGFSFEKHRKLVSISYYETFFSLLLIHSI